MKIIKWILIGLMLLGFLVVGASAEVLGPGWHQGVDLPRRSANEVFQSMVATDPVAVADEPIEMAAESEPQVFSGVGESERVQELAAALQNNPVLIFDYVRNSVAYVPYYGLLKGAERTLLDGAGNDSDQAALLVELLRAAGYNAGFVFGTMSIPYWSGDGADLGNWLGVPWWKVESCLNNGGIPFDYGMGYEFDLIRVWVRVWVDGEVYDLDPALVFYEESTPADLSQMLAYDRASFLSSAGGSGSADYFQGMGQGGISNYLSGLTTDLCEQLSSGHPNASFKDVVGGRTMIEEEIVSMSGQVRAPVLFSFYEEELGSDLYHPFSLIYGGMNWDFCLHDIASQGLTLRFSGSEAPLADPLADPVTEETPIQELAAEPAQPIAELFQDQGVSAADSENPLADFGAVYNRAPYNIKDLIFTQQPSYDETVSFPANPQSAFSNHSFRDNDNNFNLKVRLDGSGKSAGIKTGQVRYDFRVSGWHYSWDYDLTGEVLDVPLYDFETVYDGGSATVSIWSKQAGISSVSLSLENNTSGAYSIVPDANYVKIMFDSEGHSSGVKTVTVVYRYTKNGWDYTYVYDLRAQVVQAPDLSGTTSWSSPPKYAEENKHGTVRLFNSGAKVLSFTSASRVGSDAGEYRIIGGDEEGTIAPGAYRDIEIRYRARSVGIHDDAKVRVDFTYDGVDYSWDVFLLYGQTVEDFYAQLWMGDELVDQKLAPIGKTNMTLTVTRPYGANPVMTADYPIKPGATYALVTGFGSSQNGECLAERQKNMKQLMASGMDGASPEVLSESLHVIGQTWLQETAMSTELLGQLLGIRGVEHHRIGLVAQEAGYYVDVKLQYGTSVETGAYDRDSCMMAEMLFGSAMEHACLEQLQSSDRAAVSTVKLLNIATTNNWKIYRVDSNNWSSISPILSSGGYSTEEIAEMDESVHQRSGVLILPEIRNVPLGDWAGMGQIQVERTPGLISVAMLIGGDYHGGYGAFEWDLDNNYMDEINSVNRYDVVENYNYEAADPVDMTTGAYLLDHEDLRIDGPLPLVFSRSYSSAQSDIEQMLGYGWTHSFNMYAQEHSAFEQGLGSRSPEEAASALVASLVIADLMENEDTPQGWMAASLVTKWATDQLIENAVSIYLGQKVITFIRQPDGTYTSPPGMAISLTKANGLYVMEERNANTYSFDTNLKLAQIADPDDNTITLSYNSDTNLETVASSFGQAIALGYTDDLLATVSDGTGRNISYQYDSDDNLTNVVDAAGFSWPIGYDTSHRIKWVKDPEGITTIQNFYNASGLVTNQISASGNQYRLYINGRRNIEENPLGGQTAYFLDDHDRTWCVEQADGSRNITVFDGQNHAIASITPNGVTNAFVYDGNHNLLENREAVGSPEERASYYGYDALHRLTAVTNPLGYVTEYTYTPTHHPDTVIEAKGTMDERETDFDYDSGGLLEKKTEGNGMRVTDYIYDSRGNPDTVISTDAGTVDYLYNARRELEEVEIEGVVTRHHYDARGLLTNTIYAVDSPNQISESKTYRDNGLLKTVIDAKGETIRYFWTPAYKEAGVVYPDNGSTTNLYDAADRLTHVRDAEGNWAELQLDAIGRVTNTIGETTTALVQYDAVGNVTNSSIDPSGLNLWTATQYDSLNQPLSVQSALSAVHSQYDLLGRKIEYTDAVGKSWETEHDALGHKTKAIRPSGAEERFIYDALGNRIGFYNAEDKPITFGFDAQGRVTAITNAIGNVTSFSYDANGNLTDRQDAKDELTEYAYDDLNRLTNIVHESEWKASFEYDASGNNVEHVSPLASVSFGYDEMNRQISSIALCDSETFVVSNFYDLNGNRTNIVYPGGLVVSYEYDEENRLSDVSISAPSAPLREFSFSYDGASRLTGMSCPNGVVSTVGYDAESRITSYTHGTFLHHAIVRDPRGFKTTEDIHAGLVPNFTNELNQTRAHNDADQLLSAGTDVYSYDEKGNMTNSAGAGYGWDYDNRLTSANNTEYFHDAFGTRIGRIHNSLTNYFVIDYVDGLKRPLAETDAAGDITRTYIWAGFRLLAHIEADGTTRYYHSDELGSTLALTDEAGTVTDHFAYSPYGQMLDHDGITDTPYQWLGGYGVYYDADTDFHLTLHRAYSAHQKRFISSDPMGIDGGVNLYAYGNLNPLSFVDPYGLCAESFWSRAGSTAAGYAANALDFVLPDALVYGAEANGGFIGALGGGGQLVENYRSGEVSLFGYKSGSVGLQLGDISGQAGVIYNLEQNKDYAGGFHSLEGSATIFGASIAVPGNTLIDGQDDGMNFKLGPWSITGSAGVGFLPASGRVAESEYSNPLTLPGVSPNTSSTAGQAMQFSHDVLRWLETHSQ